MNEPETVKEAIEEWNKGGRRDAGGKMNEPETVKEAIEEWDKGEVLWSLACGGFGPGYEQAIQVAVIEVLRLVVDKPVPDPLPDDWGQVELHQVNHNCHLGLSGAQADTIRWLAGQAMKLGWKARNDDFRRKCKGKGEEDRMIMVSSHWPSAPELTPRYMMMGVGEVL